MPPQVHWKLGACVVLVLLVSGCSNPRPQQNALTLTALETARPDAVWDERSALRSDFDCDGVDDLGTLGREQGNVLVGVARGSAQPPQILDFAIDASVQAAICAEPAELSIESQDEAENSLEGFRRSRSCQGLRLSGGECDAIHLYWNHTTNRLGWWRN